MKDHCLSKASLAMFLALIVCVSSPAYAMDYVNNMAATPGAFNSQTGSTTISFGLQNISNGSGKLEIHDAGDQVVRSIAVSGLGSGPNHVVWDGKDNGGSPVKEGKYIALINLSMVDGKPFSQTAGAMGNVTLLVDNTGPQTAATIAGTRGDQGWYTSNAIVSITAADTPSGIYVTQYTMDGGAWMNYTSPITVGEGAHKLAYRSIDRANNIEQEKTVDVNVDTIDPTIITMTPLEGATASVKATINLTFNEPMNTNSINSSTFKLLDISGNQVASHISYQGNVATLKPDNTLTPGTDYKVIVSSAIKDIHGNVLQAGLNRTFHTSNSQGAPIVQSTSPSAGATGVPVDVIITVTFDSAMDPDSINGETFLLMDDYGDPIDGTVEYTTHATFTSTIILCYEVSYTAVITTGARNIDGTPLGANYTWTFTTGSLTADDDYSHYRPGDEGELPDVYDDNSSGEDVADNDTQVNETVELPLRDNTSFIDNESLPTIIPVNNDTIVSVTATASPTSGIMKVTVTQEPINPVPMTTKGVLLALLIASAYVLRRVLIKI